MARTSTVIIGAGQAGLAMSRCLSTLGIDHVVLERGRVGERWRSERWDSLRLLTPRWQSRLPGWRYTGGDPHGYMTMTEVTAYLSDYARSMAAPVHEATQVLAVDAAGEGYAVTTDRGTWRARTVVIATGACAVPAVPAAASGLAPRIHQLAPTRYRNPASIPAGGVLVVGASASGVQIADELARAGRPVTLAVGSHTRLPRLYRGCDIMCWLEDTGILDRRAGSIRDLDGARRAPSLQLVGHPDRRDLDLAGLQRRGVRLVGRVVGADGARVALADDLAETTGRADRALARLLDRIDAFARQRGLDALLPPGHRPRPVVPPVAPTALDLADAGIGTVLWATGFRRRYPWLHVPVIDAHGDVRHHGGVTPAPGLYVLGMPLLRRRKSTYIDGVGDDARALAAHLAHHLGHQTLALAS